MQRIKYTKLSKTEMYTIVFDIFANKVSVIVSGNSPYIVTIRKNEQIKRFKQTSLQNAKRKVREILKNDFEVNIKDEVRSKLCF